MSQHINMQPTSPRKHATVEDDPSPSPSAPPTMQGSTQRNDLHPTTSNASDSSYQAQPLKEAVSMAFDRSDASHQFSPDLVAQITQQVMNNLRMNGIASGGHAPQKPATAAPPSMTDSTPSIPPRDVYTPPSPNRDELSRVASHQPAAAEAQLDGMGARHNPPNKPIERNSIHKDDASSTASGRECSPPNGDPTTLEKIWQPMFGDDGKPLLRLGQLLRGIALHIIEDFEPRNSLVITPQKMLRFYDTVRITEEVYPWADIFGGKMTNGNISHLYRDLECQHHFVQRQFDEKPSIPALTPLGFQCWMTHIIQAHPEEEFMRLAKVAMDMPISNADDRKERFPKQLSRRLFPKQPNRAIRDLFEDAVLADPVIELPRHGAHPSFSSQPPQQASDRPASNAPPPQPPQQPQSQPDPQMPPPPQASHLNASFDRERMKPYSAPASDTAVEDGPPLSQSGAPPVFLERDRKPYFAQPGCGKVYESDDGGASRSTTKLHRSNTLSSRPPLTDNEIPDRTRSRRPRAGSQSSGAHSGSSSSYLQPRRIRSPSITNRANPFTKSEEAMPPSSYPNNNGQRMSNMYDDSDNEMDRSHRQPREERTRRRRTVDMHASYPTQPKPIFDPPQYQRQSGDAQSGHPPPPPPNSGYTYPPPPRY